jgi:hypothetical protein
LAVTTIRVVCRTNTFKTKGTMLEGVTMSEMRVRRKSKLGIVGVSAIGVKRGEAVRSVRWRT